VAVAVAVILKALALLALVGLVVAVMVVLAVLARLEQPTQVVVAAEVRVVTAGLAVQVLLLSATQTHSALLIQQVHRR